MMSAWTYRKRSGSRMWAMLASDPVSKLSTQITRCPRASSSSQRCEPRKPAPPVTRAVDIAPENTRVEWLGASAGRPCAPRRCTESGIEVAELYTEADLPAELELGEPGEFPYARGVHREMYRKQTWTMRQYAGYASAKESNERYRYLLSKGSTGLSMTFDLPTQLG